MRPPGCPEVHAADRRGLDRPLSASQVLKHARPSSRTLSSTVDMTSPRTYRIPSTGTTSFKRSAMRMRCTSRSSRSARRRWVTVSGTWARARWCATLISSRSCWTARTRSCELPSLSFCHDSPLVGVFLTWLWQQLLGLILRVGHWTVHGEHVGRLLGVVETLFTLVTGCPTGSATS